MLGLYKIDQTISIMSNYWKKNSFYPRTIRHNPNFYCIFVQYVLFRH